MEEKVNAVVLKSVDYGDNDKIITLFSMEKGLIGAALKGVKKANAKLKFAGQPFCFCEFILSVSGTRCTVTNASIIEGFYGIREDIYKFYAGSVALEYLKNLIFDEDEGHSLFVLLIDFLKTLEFSSVDPRLLVADFLLKAIRINGYELLLDKCYKCGETDFKRWFFNFDASACTCENCQGDDDKEMSPMTRQLLLFLQHNVLTDSENTQEFNLSAENKAIKLLAFYIEYNLGIKLKTARELISL